MQSIRPSLTSTLPSHTSPPSCPHHTLPSRPIPSTGGQSPLTRAGPPRKAPLQDPPRSGERRKLDSRPLFGLKVCLGCVRVDIALLLYVLGLLSKSLEAKQKSEKVSSTTAEQKSADLLSLSSPESVTLASDLPDPSRHREDNESKG